jgi:2-C-methyl-D-erythritol 4-phosphate cytidylyltransferase
MYITAIVLAAGKGLRFKSTIPKATLNINHKPIIIYSLEALSRHPEISDVILVVNSANKNRIVKILNKYGFGKAVHIVKGGRRRQDSVFCGLRKVNKRSELVLIHDGARPMLTNDILHRVINAAKKSGAAITGVPVKVTIKEASGNLTVNRTLDRNKLWEIQTPQVFRRELILKAYQRYAKIEATDDASLVEKMGVQVKVVPGAYTNIKITTPEDALVAQAILKYGI